MAAALRNMGTPVYTATNVANGTLTPTLPTRSNNDLLLCFAWTEAIAGACATPSGWTLLSGFPKTHSTSNGGRLYIFGRVADGTETNPGCAWTGLTTGNSGTPAGAVVASFSGVDVSSGVAGAIDAAGVSSSNAAAANISVPGITTNTSNALIVSMGIKPVTSTTFTPPAAYSEFLDSVTSSGADMGAAIVGVTKSTAGAQAAQTITSDTTTSNISLGVTLALKTGATLLSLSAATATLAESKKLTDQKVPPATQVVGATAKRVLDIKALPAAQNSIVSLLRSRLYFKELLAGSSASYNSEVLADTPMLFWKLNEASGTNADDSTANNRDGTYSGPTLGQEGLDLSSDDTCPSFTTDDFVVIDSFSPFSEASTESRSFDCLVTYTRSGTTKRTLLSEKWSNSMRFNFAGNDVEFWRNPAGGSPAVWTGAAPPDGEPTHVGVTVNGSTGVCELFINGVSQGTQTSGSFFPNSAGFVVGVYASDSPSLPWEGKIAKVAVYNGILAASRFEAHADAAFSAPSAGGNTMLGLLSRHVAASRGLAFTGVLSAIKRVYVGSVLALTPVAVSMRRAVSSFRAVAEPQDPSLTKRTNKSPAAPEGSSAATARTSNIRPTAPEGSLGTLTRRADRSIASGSGLLGSLAKLMRKDSTVAQDEVATVVTNRAYLRSLAAATPVVGSLVRHVNASRTAVASAAASITRALSALRTLSAATSQVASARRATSRSTTASEPEAAVVSRYPQQITRADLPQSASIRRSISRRFASVASSVATLFAGSFVPDLLFPLKVRVQEYVAKAQAIEPGNLLVKVREAVASVKVSEPEVKARGYEPEARVQADESGSMIVEVNEEGSDK